MGVRRVKVTHGSRDYKILYVVLIVVLTVFFTLLPLSLKKVEPALQTRVLSLCNSFAGGVFLASGLVHLLSEADEMVRELGEPWNEYPIAGILAVAGFLTVFFIEQVLLSKLGHTHSHGDPVHEKHTEPGLEAAEYEMEEKKPAPVRIEAHSETVDTNNFTAEIENEATVTTEKIDPVPSSVNFPLSFTSIALVIIISAHSFFTGVTMGAQSDLAATTEILFTVLSHKWIEAFALGSNLIRNGETVGNIIKITLAYSLTLPLGVITGAVVILVSAQFADVSTMIATGFGSGSFIYVAIIDILVVEFASKLDTVSKFSLVSAGFICLTTLFVIFDSD